MPHHLQRLAFLSTHSSPLAQPGTTKAGGMNVYIAALTSELGRSGRRVDIFTRSDRADLPPVVELTHNVRVINVAAGCAQPLAPLDVHEIELEFRRGVQDFVAAEAAAHPNDRPYDLIHSHYWVSAVTGMSLAQEWRRPHVAMFHTLGEVKNRARRGEREPLQRIQAERAIVVAADRLICATPHEKNFLVELYGAQASCVSVVPGGVNLDRFQPPAGSPAHNAARARLAIPPGSPVVLFVGRLEPLKGVDILIRAAALADAEPPMTLLIVGGGADDAAQRANLQALAYEAGLGDRIRFIDAVGHDQIVGYYQAADVCVIPSYYESFGLVAVEALACGTPVIATRVGGLQYTVRDGETGYLISWRCPEPFAERLEALLANDDLRGRFGRAARDSVRPFDWRAVTAQIVDIYEDLLVRYSAVADCRAS